MEKSTLFILVFTVLTVLANGCTPALAPVPPTFTPSPIPPTFTLEPTARPAPTATATLIPSPTPLPGSVVLPVDTLGEKIPWLPLDETARPRVDYVGFNTAKPPFNSPLVRRAFAYSVDRQVLVEMMKKYMKNAVPATSFTPPQTLGRDLDGEVGISFDPQKAKDCLTEAGYSDTSSFPKVVFLVNSAGDVAPGARFNMASAMAEMWQTHLGISVQVEAMKPPTYRERLLANPPDVFWIGWVADYNDPANFIGEIFNPNGEYQGDYNYGKFSNSEFNELIDHAAGSNDPAERQILYIQAERLLTETETAIIPLFHFR